MAMRLIYKNHLSTYGIMKICIIGLGFVGNAMYRCFHEKGIEPYKYLFGYDKFCKEKGTSKFDDVYQCDIVFLALPTQYEKKIGKYDKSAIYETCDKLLDGNFSGAIIIKSTVEPNTTFELSNKYPKLQFIHNPEFLTARTAYDDFNNQKHIILGKGLFCTNENYNNVLKFYEKYFPDAEISKCSSLESESMKIFANCFYAQKVQIFTEYYLLCEKTGCDYKTVIDMMIKNNWLNPMHTKVPGPDKNISYGGLCFPKDTNALLMYMKNNETPHKVLEATITERNAMRDDHDNCK